LNIVAIYIFVYVINSLDLGVQLKVISLWSVALLSIILVIFNFIFKKL
jgi:hypothetical protein